MQLSGVITDSEVSVEPAKIGAGPIVLIVSNQTEESHTVTLEGPSGTETVGPINPLDTGRIQHDLAQGAYEVKAGSDKAVEREIDPAVADRRPAAPVLVRLRTCCPRPRPARRRLRRRIRGQCPGQASAR